MLPLPLRGLRGWGVRFSEFANNIIYFKVLESGTFYLTQASGKFLQACAKVETRYIVSLLPTF